MYIFSQISQIVGEAGLPEILCIFFSNFTDCRRRWFTRDFMYIFSQISQIVEEDGLPEILCICFLKFHRW